MRVMMRIAAVMRPVGGGTLLEHRYRRGYRESGGQRNQGALVAAMRKQSVLGDLKLPLCATAWQKEVKNFPPVSIDGAPSPN